MRKALLILFLLCAAAISASAVFAQSQDAVKEFPDVFHLEYFKQDSDWEFYRFPTLVPFFDPLDLSYFPHETWRETDWSLLGRRKNLGIYQQLIMVDQPAATWIFHGTSVPKERGFTGDFYLYATLFITDSYPDDKGSCYVYYSDSMIQGFDVSHGILVDPLSGVYRVENHYGTSYNLTNKSHELTIIKSIHPEDFPLSEKNIRSTSVGGPYYPKEQSDDKFAVDLGIIRDRFHLQKSSVKAFRVELIRKGTNLQVYLNGKLAAEVDDGITVPAAEGETGPADMVSWSYGPMLHDGGVTVTCNVGDFVLRVPGK